MAGQYTVTEACGRGFDRGRRQAGQQASSFTWLNQMT
jgi:hypothetical protein